MIMDKNALRMMLMHMKTMAVFSHYCAGNLYYKVKLDEGTYQFPIPTVENEGTILSPVDGSEIKVCQLSSDLGTTTFSAEERASMLWRWIDKAIDTIDFVKVE